MGTRRILVSGSSGLIGTRLVAALRSDGDLVVPLVRREAEPPAIVWDPWAGVINPEAVGGFDAVVHLAGEPIAARRWTADQKRRIFDSRVAGTTALVKGLVESGRPPAVFVSASGINYYGDCGDAEVDETRPAGAGFLADVCAAWEAAAAPLAGASRVVSLRTGMVLAADGGPLAAMLPVFRMGLGGPIAGGRKFISWVTIDDTIRAIVHAIGSPTLRGPVNLVAPAAVTNRQFTRELAAALGRPARVPVPGWVVRLAFGGIADETALCGIRAVPRRLLEDGFLFNSPEIGGAMRAVFCH